MLAAQRRAPWWQWVLLSLGISLFVLVMTVAGIVALAWRGVDLLDYIFLARPPYLTDGFAAAWIAMLVAGPTLASVLAMLLFRPTRAVVQESISRSGDPSGLVLRIAVGALLVVGLQVVWDALGPQPAEPWRVVEHLVYATVRGGQVWPMVWLVVAVGVVGPAAEELVFRGFLFRSLRKRWGFWIGALASAAVFGLSHGLVTAFPTAVLGLYFAYQTERDGTLAGAVGLHVLNNVGALLVISAAL